MPSKAASPYRIALLSNPLSRRNRTSMAKIHALANRHGNIDHYQASTPAEILGCLKEIATNPPDVVAINGGDGTVQAALTALLGDRPFAEVPLLALVPGGNTNMTARDIGPRQDTMAALRKIVVWAQNATSTETVTRPIVEVRAHADATPRYGMFFGIGAITKGIEYCHHKVYKLGLGNEIAPGLAGARVLFDVIRGKSAFNEPLPMQLEINGETIEEVNDCLLLLVSTLERLFLGMRPYWGIQHEPLHFTWIRGNPERPFRTFPSILRGKPNRFATAQNGYASHNVNNIKITSDSVFTLDGELYQADAATGPIHVSHTEPLHFLRV